MDRLHEFEKMTWDQILMTMTTALQPRTRTSILLLIGGPGPRKAKGGYLSAHFSHCLGGDCHRRHHSADSIRGGWRCRKSRDVSAADRLSCQASFGTGLRRIWRNNGKRQHCAYEAQLKHGRSAARSSISVRKRSKLCHGRRRSAGWYAQ
jgi:hypothetical protein